MILITGAYGFIGSCLASYFNQQNRGDLILVDDFSKQHKAANIQHLKYAQLIERSDLLAYLQNHKPELEFVYHLGARTDTTAFDQSIFLDLNLNYSKFIWTYCTNNNVPLIYASSAATYGQGEWGYKDGIDNISNLKPLNLYGQSKQDFDLWVAEQITAPPFWAGLKFFNVYGPNEYHKGRMASVVFHAFNKIKETQSMQLFRSHKRDFAHGEQKRDFVYVKEVLDMIMFLTNNNAPSDIYNVGTGLASSFNQLANAVFKAMDIKTNISYIDTPEDIRDKYQYYTKASMQKLTDLGYKSKYTSFEMCIEDYISNYLASDLYF